MLYLQGAPLNQAVYPDLKGKFAIITGASRGNGIGAATCRALAMQGANILFTSWQAYDREQPHGVDENGPIALEQALQNSGVLRGAWKSTCHLQIARRRSWMLRRTG